MTVAISVVIPTASAWVSLLQCAEHLVVQAEVAIQYFLKLLAAN